MTIIVLIIKYFAPPFPLIIKLASLDIFLQGLTSIIGHLQLPFHPYMQLFEVLKETQAPAEIQYEHAAVIIFNGSNRFSGTSFL